MDLSLLSENSLPVDVGYLHLVRFLGEGNGGRSFVAESRGTGGLPSRVAVTVLPPGLLEDRQRWRDVQTEVSRAALLRHRGIVRTFSLAVESGSPYLISELVEGVNLKQMLARGGPLTPRQGLDIGIQLISALGAAHECRPGSGDIPQPHGELRPSAVMLSVEGVVKLRGFGLAKVYPSRPGLEAVGFAAPEALSGQRLTLGTDLFSLGGLLFFLLTGEVPFPVHLGASAGERIAATVKGLRGGRVFSDVNRVVPGLGDALGRMLCLDPALRFAGAGEAEAVFREVRGALPRSSRLNEVITERFGEGLVDTPSAQSGVAPGLLEVELSRDLGVPAPPPIPVPSREIVDAPRAGPVLVAPGPVSVPPQEAFRPPTPAPAPASVARPEARDTQETAPAASSRLEELSLDFDGETTDAVAPLDRLLEPSVEGAGSLVETAPHAGAIEPAPSASDFARARPSLERTEQTAASAAVVGPRGSKGDPRANGGPLQRALVWVVCVLGVLVLGLLAVLKLGGPPEPQVGEAESSSDQGADEAHAGTTAEAETTGLGQSANSPDGNSGSSEPDVGAPDGASQSASGAENQGASGRNSRSDAEGSVDGSPPERREESVEEERARLRREAIERRRTREAKARQEPVEVDSGSPVRLAIIHSPIRSARMGSSELMTVRMTDAPRSSRVVLHAGPRGGPYKKSRLKAKSGGRWEGWIDFRGTSEGGEFHYWLVASHPRAPASATSGSRSAPNRVEIE